jgi:transposase InsO family protein
MFGLMLSGVVGIAGGAMPIRERAVVDIREEMAVMAADDRFTVSEIAERYGVSRPTVRLWRDRYRKGGRAGLVDRSHAVHGCPHQTSEAIERLILAERARFGWGSKKILRRLRDADPELELPGRSAVDALLSRHGLVKTRRRRTPQTSTPFRRRYTASEPSELMTIDHKGQFRMLNGKYCYPLTIVDSVSRCLLSCEALTSTRLSEAWPVIERVFRECGLPVAMQSDNGPPFGSPNGTFSTMSVRLMKLGVLPVFGRPAHPQDNGRHERMHLDLKAETTRPPAATRFAQQKKFDEFVHRYNIERPHEGIEMQRPATVFRNSPRPFPRKRPRPEYPAYFETRKVSDGGAIKWRNQRIFLAEPLGGQTVGIEPTDEGICTVHFYNFRIGKIDETNNVFI